MNNYQLHFLLKRHRHTRHIFKSVTTADNVPQVVIEYPAFYISNQSKLGEKGSHWVVLGFSHKDAKSEFFDSRAHGLDSYLREIKSSLIRNGNGRTQTNADAYQPEASASCGEYCCWFIEMRCLGRSYDNCVSLLSKSDLEGNQIRVQSYVTNHMTKP